MTICDPMSMLYASFQAGALHSLEFVLTTERESCSLSRLAEAAEGRTLQGCHPVLRYSIVEHGPGIGRVAVIPSWAANDGVATAVPHPLSLISVLAADSLRAVRLVRCQGRPSMTRSTTHQRNSADRENFIAKHQLLTAATTTQHPP